MFKKILVCLDGSKLAEQILPYAQAQAIKFKGKLILLQVVAVTTMDLASTGTPAGPISGRLTESEANIYLKKIAKSLEKGNLEVDNVVLQETSVSKAILKYADKQGIDLICLASHGHSGFKHMVFGSTADQLLRESSIPILIIKPLDKPVP
jgi:nucleotide-binding universal stress UspA family protein